MELFLREIEKALDNDLYYLALQFSLTLPDICGALQSEDGNAKGERYKDWYDTYAKESSSLAIDGKDCYYFRCSCLHQGTSVHSKSSYSRIMFIVPNPTLKVHNSVINNALCIDVDLFCRNMIDSVRRWLESVKDKELFKKNYEKLFKLYPNGLAPYIVGLPVIS